MGLDMFAWRVRSDMDLADVDPEITSRETGKNLPGVERDELFYWRKHPNLHGWMEALYYEKGGTSDCFNCNRVRLTVEDLDRLENDINSDHLPETSGFFFGTSTPDDKVGDLEFIGKARQAIADGYAVYYDSWW